MKNVISKVVSGSGWLIFAGLALCAVAVWLPLSSFVREQSESGVVYYVSPSGNDNNSGTSLRKAWRSIEKVNSARFHPGDRILFKRGGIWSSEAGLVPAGEGLPGKPITVGAYGKGEKPVIAVLSGEMNAITLKGQSYWTIEDLEVRSKNHNGISVEGAVNKRVSGITIRKVRATECSPHVGQREFDHCGIKVGSHGKPRFPEGSWLEDIIIEECEVSKAGVGIMISGRGFDATTEVAPGDSISKNCHIRNCRVSDIAGDGIVIFSAANVSIERSVCYNASTYNADEKATAGIWTWNVRNAVVRYNESYGHITPGIDRNPFDIDYRSENSLYEYNYGHDSYGAAMLICAPRESNHRAVFRYSVFKNCGMDGSRESAFIKFYDCETPGQERFIYNNTFIGSPAHFISSTKDKAYAFIYNNIFYHTKGLKYNGFLEEGMHGNNLFFNITDLPDEPGSVFSDPIFADTAHTGAGFCDGLKLRAGSPAVDRGIDPRKLGSVRHEDPVFDFWQNKVPLGKGFDIGAHEQ